jgi:enoyl-[acyl-carrier-protein] reductase (NADH)
VTEVSHPPLAGKKALVIGIANDSSIAWGCAKAFHEVGAEVAVTYLSDKARPHVEPLAKAIDAPIFMPLDVTQPGQLEAVFERIARDWGRLDMLVHSIAFAPKADLQGGLLDCSAEGFGQAMDVSCHSFIRMAKLAAPLMTEGGTMFAMSYHGANRVVPNYNVMGPVKAALEAACRYLRARPAGHPRARDLARPAEDPRGVGPEGFRGAAERDCGTRPAGRAGRHHGRGLRLRLHGDAVCAPDLGQHRLRRRRREHHGVTVGHRNDSGFVRNRDRIAR